jgi:aminopeptidase N
VTVDRVAATSTTDGDELVITPATPLRSGQPFTVTVAYGGVPVPYQEPGLGEVGFLASAQHGVIAVGEPEVAASWFPVNDHPSDKATYTIAIAAPDGLSALSNGVLTAKTSARGYTTWTWRESVPMAPYLATVVIGRYRVHEGNHDGKPVLTAVDPSLPSTIDAVLARTPEVADYLAGLFGPYPFDAYGGIVVADDRVTFALENQSRPVYSRKFFTDPRRGLSVVVHELAHQWFGDSVSVRSWSEVWLNEGFATYAQWLWTADHGGDSVQATFDDLYNASPPALWTTPPGDPPRDDLFTDNHGDSVYTRGAMTLQALRVTVGDDVFFRIVRAWAGQQAGGSASTAQFIALADQVSGRHLDQLFADWLYGTVRPGRPSAA